VIELPEFEEPETAKAVQLLKEWEVTGKILLVVSAADEEVQDKAWLSFRNLPHVLTVTYPTAYTVLAADTVIFTRSALDELTTAAAARAAKKGATGSSAAPATAVGSGSRSAREETRTAPKSVPESSPTPVTPNGPDPAESSALSEPEPEAPPTEVTGSIQATDTANSGGKDLGAARPPQSTEREPEPESGPVTDEEGTRP